jgi:tetratricopeptide (TPR) repeat protein
MALLFFLKRLGMVLGLLGILLASPVIAQPVANPANLKKAQKLSEEAAKFFFKNDFQKALSLFQQAYELNQSPPLLYNIGVCYQKLSQPEEAQKAFCEYLTTPDTLRRDKATAALKEINPSGKLCPKDGANKHPFLLSESLFLAGGLAGTGSILMRLVAPGGPGALFPQNVDDANTITLLNHTMGAALALTADLSFIAGGITLLRAKKKQKTDVALLYPGGPYAYSFSLRTTLPAPNNAASGPFEIK